jgi:hypothetical protein
MQIQLTTVLKQDIKTLPGAGGRSVVQNNKGPEKDLN